MFDDRDYDYFAPSDTPQSRSLICEVVTAAREENRAAARRLGVIAELFELRRNERGEHENWAVDTWAAVGAEVSAALRISLGKAGTYMNYGLAMRRLPAVATLFRAGDIDMQTFATIVYRTDLITRESVLAQLDHRLAARAANWPSMTRGRLIGEIDRLVTELDPDAVRRTRNRARDRNVSLWDYRDGTADLSGRLLATDAQLLDRRLDALAATVCDEDPRTVSERRADALGALASGAERLMCQCGAAECPATTLTSTSVVIHVIAEQSALDGDSQRPGYLLGADTLISAELLRDVAKQARLRPLAHLADSPAEPRYQPSRRLADFVRARDLTCRAPGCDRPATACDLDHTTPWPRGATHASNLKALCRFHHLLKTFWGWRDRQLPDGTVIWTLPDGHTYVTVPGSALLFPGLMTPTGHPPIRIAEVSACGDLTAFMPLRKQTRAANRSHRIAAERSNSDRLGAPF